MKWIIALLCTMFISISYSQTISTAIHGFKWKNQIHTADSEAYYTQQEKLLFYYINLARTQPKYFADSVLKPYQGAKGFDNRWLEKSTYVKSLYEHLKKMKPLNALLPDKQLFTYATCFAKEAGKLGIIGHDRKGTTCTFAFAECCSYGYQYALDIVLQLLIDDGIESLGHRLICLGNYTHMGVSIQPHKDYKQNAVLNFK